ncbi:MAG: beta-aspartyl-dipeptidase (metallo-type) [Vicingaceae bacterium]|jgi:beta-aspartyl-dipeptidase (metallo-type)
MLLIKNAHIYSPEDIGVNDILVGGGKILSIQKNIECNVESLKVWNAEGKMVLPGFIDQHVHVIGAGGKHGFSSMTPEIKMTEFIATGTTTAVGLLGTDGSTRSIKTLYAKVKSLETEGMSAYMFTGYYGLEPTHIMDSIQDEMIFIDKVLGCKIAIADIRSSYPTDLELLRIVRQVRVGGMVGEKKGIMHLHLGNHPERLDCLFRLVEEHHFPIENISPTHVGRTEELFKDAIRFAKMGGMIDITTGASQYTKPYKSVLYALENGVDIETMTFSSDGNAGLEKLDENGKLIGFRRAPIDQNFGQVVELVKNSEVSISDAFKIITTNPAKNLGLKYKGQIKEGFDADFCCLTKDLELCDVFAKGKQMMDNFNVIAKDSFS